MTPPRSRTSHTNATRIVPHTERSLTATVSDAVCGHFVNRKGKCRSPRLRQPGALRVGADEVARVDKRSRHRRVRRLHPQAGREVGRRTGRRVRRCRESSHSLRARRVHAQRGGCDALLRQPARRARWCRRGTAARTRGRRMRRSAAPRDAGTPPSRPGFGPPRSVRPPRASGGRCSHGREMKSCQAGMIRAGLVPM